MTPPSSKTLLISNQDVAEIFYHMASLLKLKAANPYRIRAYERAAQTIEFLPSPLKELSYEELLDLPGIGTDLAAKITEILLTGGLKAYQQLQQEIKPEIIDLMELQGLGPKRVKQLVEELDIRNMADLEEAAWTGKIHELPGFGLKSEENIVKAIELHRTLGRRMKLSSAENLAAPLVQYLKHIKGVDAVEVAGSFRRKKETVGDLDILVTGSQDSPVVQAFTEYPLCQEIISQGPTRSSIRLTSGIQVDLRFVRPEDFGAALYYFTGSKEHNLAVRSIAKSLGLKINEYGVFQEEKRIAGETERSVFEAVHLPFIPPVLRENMGEIEAAQSGKLPILVQAEDIRGDLHDHTQATDGSNTLEEMALKAMESGLEYVAITDHSKSTARGLTEEEFYDHLKAIDEMNRKLPDIQVLKGVEVDIRKDGRLDLPDELLAKMDVVVASIHNYFNLNEGEQTERLLRAIQHPLVHIIGHPTARKLTERPSIKLDTDRIFEAAAQNGTWLEINASPDRLDLYSHLIKSAKDKGAHFIISTDAHHANHYQNLRFGIYMAQRGWLEKEDVINTLPAKKFMEALREKRHALGV